MNDVNPKMPEEDLCGLSWTIMEQDGESGNAGDDAVFRCEGTFQGWFHRICVGL